MSDPTPVDPAGFFDFLEGPGLAVVFLSAHPLHQFNRALGRHLREEHAGIALGTVDLRDLFLSGSPAVRFLHERLRGWGGPGAFGVLPGYWLFRGTDLLAWQAGLPAFEDIQAIARSALLGAVWSGLTRNLAFVGQAVQLAAEELAAQRVASAFRYAATAPPGRPAGGRPPAEEDLAWACQVLGVSPGATEREIHEAWRRRRTEAHPDHAAQDPAEFDRRSRLSAEINRARDVLTATRARRPS
jgi:hypothetical protein